MLAAFLETPRPERLYGGLSVLVSAAAEGRPARGLASFGALALLLEPTRFDPAGLPAEGAARLARSFAELLATAGELPGCRLWACSAAVDTMGLDPAALAAPLEGVMSTPRFLRETAGAELLYI